MKNISRRLSLSLVLPIVLAIGCGGPEPADTPAPAADGSGSDDAPPADSAAATDQVFKYTLSEISPMGDYGPPLDEGRVDIAPPKNWTVGGRLANLVIWFHQFKDPKLLPQIRVTAEDAPADAPQNATVEDAKAYADWVGKWVAGQIGDEKLVEPVVPLVLGNNAFGRYVRAGKYKESIADRQILVTTIDGRIYTIETIVFQGGLKSSRETVLDGYAVGASLKKSEGGGIGGFSPPGE